MELNDGPENVHLLEQSPTAISEYSDGSVPTVVGSPHPDYLDQRLNHVHSANDTVHERHLTPRELGLRTEGLRLEFDGFQPPIRSHINGEASNPHANTWTYGNYQSTQLKDDQPSKPLKAGSSQYSLLATPDEKKNPTSVRVPRLGPGYVSAKNVKCNRNRLVSIGIPVVALYATALSGFWFSLAIWRPSWGQIISTSRKGITLANASVACTLLAKSIEVSLVTLFVAFLGQKLSRRALFDQSKGISLAQISMKIWVVQPGSIVSHFELLRYAGLTYLGVMTLSVTVFAMLYTAASDALGRSSPKFVPLYLYHDGTRCRANQNPTDPH